MTNWCIFCFKIAQPDSVHVKSSRTTNFCTSAVFQLTITQIMNVFIRAMVKIFSGRQPNEMKHSIFYRVKIFYHCTNEDILIITCFI